MVSTAPAPPNAPRQALCLFGSAQRYATLERPNNLSEELAQWQYFDTYDEGAGGCRRVQERPSRWRWMARRISCKTGGKTAARGCATHTQREETQTHTQREEYLRRLLQMQ